MEKTVKAELILENGARFRGSAFGYIKETVGEVVFTTGMTGYQETLTDPSFAGQIVTMTYPLIGNYGINLEDMESRKPFLKGFIVREKCDVPNNWRCEMELDGFLKQNKIMGLEGIDTRALTRVLRDNGTMRGIITTRFDDLTSSQIRQKFDTYSNQYAVKETTCEAPYTINGKGTHLAVLDCGIKQGILRDLSKRGCKLSVFPAYTSAEEILSVNPDAIFLGNRDALFNHSLRLINLFFKILFQFFFDLFLIWAVRRKEKLSPAHRKQRTITCPFRNIEVDRQ